MAVISDYEEEEQTQSHTSTPRQAKRSEPVKPPESEAVKLPMSEPVKHPDSEPVVVNPPEEQPRPPLPSPSPSPPQSDEKIYQHDPVLRALLEEHKRQPLELLTTIIDFLFRETDLSRESSVEYRVTEIVTEAKRRRSACDGEDVTPEMLAKVEETKSSKKEAKSPKTATETPYQTPRGDETTESSDVTLPDVRKDTGFEQAEIDAEGTGLRALIFRRNSLQEHCVLM